MRTILTSGIIVAALQLNALGVTPGPVWVEADQVIATVGEKPLRIKDVLISDHKVNISSGHVRSKIRLQTIQVAEQIVIEKAIADRKIVPDKEAVISLAATTEKKTWNSFGPTPKKRLEVFAKTRRQSQIIYDGLQIWKQDHDAGDAYFTKTLAPQGITDQIWTWYKGKAENKESMSQLLKLAKYDRKMHKENHLVSARRFLERQILKKAVVKTTAPTEDQIDRLFLLVEGTQNIDVSVIYGKRDAVEAAAKASEKTHKITLGSDARISRQTLGGDQLGRYSEGYSEVVMGLAVYAEVIKKDAQSKIYSVLNDGKIVYMYVYIHKIEAKEDSPKLNKKTKDRLRAVISEWMLNKGYRTWLEREVSRVLKFKIEALAPLKQPLNARP